MRSPQSACRVCIPPENEMDFLTETIYLKSIAGIACGREIFLRNPLLEGS